MDLPVYSFGNSYVVEIWIHCFSFFCSFLKYKKSSPLNFAFESKYNIESRFGNDILLDG
jgi:hypothetical protein